MSNILDIQYVITALLEDNIRVYYRFQHTPECTIRSWAFTIEHATKYLTEKRALEVVDHMDVGGIVSIQKIVTTVEDA